MYIRLLSLLYNDLDITRTRFSFARFRQHHYHRAAPYVVYATLLDISR